MAKQTMNIASLKNLPQYRNLTEEEIEKKYYSYAKETDRVQNLMDNMAKDYELTDLNENDRQGLQDYCLITVRIEELEKIVSEKIHDTDESIEKWNEIDKINRILTSLRESSSKIQTDLNMTRKARKGDNETSVVNTIEEAKSKAKAILNERLSYIYCPKCKMLLANTWFLFPDVSGGNSITLTCGRKLSENKICGHKFTVTSSELSEKGNRNITDVLPV